MISGLVIFVLFLVACARQADESAFAGQAIGKGNLPQQKVPVSEKPKLESYYCGDGIIGGKEKCDGKNLGGKTCSSSISNTNPNVFNGGELTCNKDCTLITNKCCKLDQKAYGFKCDNNRVIYSLNDSCNSLNQGLSFEGVAEDCSKTFAPTKCISPNNGNPALTGFGYNTTCYPCKNYKEEIGIICESKNYDKTVEYGKCQEGWTEIKKVC